MAAPLIVAGAKVAGKAVAKKVLAKKAAGVAAKQAGKQVVKKGTQKLSSNAVKGRLNSFKRTYDKTRKTKDLKDKITPEQEEEREKDNRTLLDRFLKKEKGRTESKEKVPSPEKKTSKLVFRSALYCAMLKDAIEIYLTYLLASWLITIISFFPSAILTALLFFSGKKSTMKMILYLLGIAIDYIVPGVNTLPIATVAVIITFKSDDFLPFLKKLKKKDVDKGLGLVKSFVK